MIFFKKIKFREVEIPLIFAKYIRINDETISIVFENLDKDTIRSFGAMREYFSLWLEDKLTEKRNIILKMRTDDVLSYIFFDDLGWDALYGTVNQHDYYVAHMTFSSMTDVTRNFDRMRKVNGIGL